MVNRILSPHTETRITSNSTRLQFVASAAVLLGVTNIALTFLAEATPLRAMSLGIIGIIECLFAAGVLLVAARSTGPTSHSHWSRRAWMCFALALLAYGLGNTIWFVIEDILQESPFPSYADVFYLSYYFLFVAGLLALPTRPFEPGERLRLSLDMGVVMIASILIFWTFLFGPIITSSTVETTWLELIAAMTYPALDLMILWVVFVLLLRQTHLSLNQPLLIPGASVAVLAISDVLLNYQTIAGTYAEHDAVSLMYSVATYLMIWAGLRQIRNAANPSDATTAQVPVATFQLLHAGLRYLPYLWVSLAYGMLIGTHQKTLSNTVADLVVAIGVGLAITLVVVRQIIAIKENAQLSFKLQRELAVRERAEQELRASQREAMRLAEEAKTASDAKSTFLAAMSHEIRTPMNGVIGFTNLLADTPLSEEQRDFVQTIKHSGESMLTLINDILDYSKIEAGKLQLEVAPFDLRACCADVLDLVTTQAMGKGLELILLADPEPFPLVGDVGRVRQVLLNLIGNAVKFTERGYVQIALSRQQPNLGVEDNEPTWAQIAIVDTGIGIPPDGLKNLFQRFVQADASTTRKYGGTGLGLAISQQLVELMGGQITVESIVGQGSVFIVRLPMSDVILPRSTVSHRSSDLIHDARIMVVDDLEVNRRMMRHLFERWNLHLTLSPSGTHALEQLRAAHDSGQPFDLLITDHLMPDITGEDLAQQIFADPDLYNMPVILFSSVINRGDGSSLLAAGFSAVLAKPLTRPSMLLDAIANSLAGRKSFRSDIVTQNNTPKMASDQRLLETTAVPMAAVRARVLLAEDNAVNQKLARLMLEKLNCRVDVAGNGIEAVQMVDQIPYDLVLMDCQMPEMDGYKATAIIRQREQSLQGTIRKSVKHLPIIALTANAMEGDRDRCLNAGMDDYLAKPIKQQSLSGMLDRWIPAEVASIDIVLNV